MASDGLSGAEIEQAVIAGLYEAFDQSRPLEMADLLDVLQDTVPLSQMMQEEIGALRSWARQRARRLAASGAAFIAAVAGNALCLASGGPFIDSTARVGTARQVSGLVQSTQFVSAKYLAHTVAPIYE